jgi:hypothetical protein
MLRIFRKTDRNPKPPVEPGFTISPGVKASVHSDGVVFLHSSTGVVFSANRVAAGIWEGICAGRTLEQISSAISRQFEAPLETVGRDTARFIANLLSEGILERAAA